MPDLYREIIEELERRGVAYVRDFAPFYISSLATHQLNLVNQRKQFYVEAGSPINLRQHILFVTIPGFGKSFLLRQFLDNEAYSIVKGTDVQCSFESYMTEAGMVGSVGKDQQGNIHKTSGLLETDSNSIIGIEEFSAITNAVQQQHNVGLDAALLTALDSGMVRKRLANGKIEYQTNLSMWAGVQPARFNLSSGLGRRFLFIYYVPTLADVREFRKRRRELKTKKLNIPVLNEIRKLLNQRFTEMNDNVTGISFTADFYGFMDALNVIHYEEVIYERLALGYWLMKSEHLTGTIYVGLDDELKRILKLQHRHRKNVKQGTQLNQVWVLIKEMKRINEKKLLELLLDFSLDWDTSRDMIRTLVMHKNIHYEGEDIVVGKA